MNLETPRLRPIELEDLNEAQQELLDRQAMRETCRTSKTLIHHEDLTRVGGIRKPYTLQINPYSKRPRDCDPENRLACRLSL